MKKLLRFSGLAAGLILCLACMSIASAVTIDATAPYSGDYYMVYNPSTTALTTAYSGSMPNLLDSRVATFAEESDTASPFSIVQVYSGPDGELMYQIEPHSITDSDTSSTSTAPSVYSQVRARSAEPQVGDERNFKAKEYVNNTVNEQTFVLQYSGTHCNIWLEKADNWQITSEMIAELGAEFDVNIYDRMTAAFGPVYDRDGDGKVAILLYDIQDGYVEGSSTPYVGGLFERGDLTGDPSYNDMDALHIDTYPSIYSHGAYNLSKSKSTMVHEFQHLIEISATLTSNVVELPLWVNEGLSTAAEHMIYGPQENRISQYNEYVEPGDPLAEWDGTLSDYALSYLFFQYLRIQTQDFTGGGEALYRQIVQTGGTATQAIEQAIKQFYPYTNMDQIIRNFYIALTLKENTGAYGFGGEAPFNAIEPKFYTGSSMNLRKGAALVKKGPINDFRPYSVSSPARSVAFSKGGSSVEIPIADLPNNYTTYMYKGITLSCCEPNATLYYTLNGTEPTESSLIYDGHPILIRSNTTLKAIAVTPDGRKSDVSTYAYTIAKEKVELFRRTEGGNKSNNVSGTDAVEAIEKDGFIQVGNLPCTALGVNDVYTLSAPEGANTVSFIAKYTYNGEQEWIRSFGGDYRTELYGVTAVSDGYIASGAVSWRSSTHTGDLANVPLPATENGGAAILVKFDKAGNIQWITPFQAASNLSCLYAVTACSDDSVIAAGATNFNEVSWLPNSVWSSVSSLSGSSGQALIVKADAQGNQIWSKPVSAGTASNFRDVALLSDNSTIVAAGSNGSKPILCTFNQNGDRLNTATYSTSGGFLGLDVLPSSSTDTVIAVGHTTDSNYKSKALAVLYAVSGSACTQKKTDSINNGTNAASVYYTDVTASDDGSEFLALLSFDSAYGYGTDCVGRSGDLKDLNSDYSYPTVIVHYDTTGNRGRKAGYGSIYSSENTWGRYEGVSLLSLGDELYTICGGVNYSPYSSSGNPCPSAFLLTFSDSESGYHRVSGNVDLPGVAIGGTVSDSNGDFQLRVKGGESVTLEPTLDGYTFAPGSVEVGPVTEDDSGYNFTPSPITYTLSGTVRDHTGKGLSGVAVGGTTSKADGSYSITVRSGANALLEPTYSGKTFEPVRRTLTAVSGSVGSLDFQVPKPRYTVSGTVTRDGVPQGGVRVGDALTAPDGSYSLSVEAGTDLTLSPVFLDYASDPEKIVLSNLSENKTGQDFELGKATSTLTLSPLKVDFEAVTVGYSPVSAVTVTVENTAGETCTGLTLSLSKDSSFELSALSDDSLAVGESVTFTVKPKDGLAAGSYSGTVTVKSGIISLSLPVTFQVKAAATEPETPTPPSGGGSGGGGGGSSSSGGSSGGGSKREEQKPTPPVSTPEPVQTILPPYLNGYDDGTFRPDAPLTRGQCAVIFSRLVQGYDPEKAYQNSFSDVGPELWFAPQISFARQEGIMKGYPDGAFRPDQPMTRAEFAYAIRGTLKLESPEAAPFSDTADHWARNAIGQLVAQDILNGYPDGTFHPDVPISRAEAAKILNRVYREGVEELPSGKAPNYSDLTKSHWAYYDILEASVEHTISQSP